MPQSSEIIKQVVGLLALHREVFGQERVYVRVVMLVLSEIFAFGSHRVTDLLRVVGLVGEDWSAWYRLYEKPKRFVEERVGAVLLRISLEHVAVNEPYVVGIDTTQVWRDSHKMEGTSWLKCPRTPPFRIGIHRAQRFLNGSWLTPLSEGFCRAIPLRFLPSFPDKAIHEEHEPCKEQQAGLAFVGWVRRQLDQHGRDEQALLCLADGAYDKVDFWRDLPSGVIALVRTAKNRALCYLPGEYSGKGRRQLYGADAPHPQDYNQERHGWQTAHLKVRGHSRRTVYRVEGPFLRRTMPNIPLFLIIVRGQVYTRSGHIKHREPVAYLVNAVHRDDRWQLPFPALTLLTWAWQRWELEVVHREVKFLFGLGDKQCFNPHAAVVSVQWSAWVYALLTFAAFRTFGLPTPPAPSAAWYPNPKRWTFSSLLNTLRADLWTHPLFCQFLSPSPKFWQNCEPLLLDFLHSSYSFSALPT